ncbi:hypothetical protein CYMTET_6200 [Cymbomonas tetramitiformis]|uniref:RNA helicase n=1 Tax=Cymbomonas tetramitiformis TaxID=36881 RepID=A0AAE0LIB0_9CHLO|nr:hypothetical protein CYMTET_6200 [Cymbomonas tetramitiformis]
MKKRKQVSDGPDGPTRTVDAAALAKANKKARKEQRRKERKENGQEQHPVAPQGKAIGGSQGRGESGGGAAVVTGRGISGSAWRKQEGVTLTGCEGDIPEPCFTFAQASFDTRIIEILSTSFAKPTAIQAQAWPIALSGCDMIAVSKTGSGKTIAFLLPAFQKLLLSTSSVTAISTKGLVLAPTRELACQIQDQATKFGEACAIRSVCLFGGAPKEPQIEAIERGAHIVVSTPGRLVDILGTGKCALDKLQVLVLDEADRMLDMGFGKQIQDVVKHVPTSRQTLLFSATWSQGVGSMASKILRNPIELRMGENDALEANADIKQVVMMTKELKKPSRLKEILDQLVLDSEGGIRRHDKAIIFVSRKDQCAPIVKQLRANGFLVDCMHGARPQHERTAIFQDFRDGKLRLLVATDVAARGLDVDDVRVVINYDMAGGNKPGHPDNVESYVHRIGRTARGGQGGVAYTFFINADRNNAADLISLLTKAGQEVPNALQLMSDQRALEKS